MQHVATFASLDVATFANLDEATFASLDVATFANLDEATCANLDVATLAHLDVAISLAHATCIPQIAHVLHIYFSDTRNKSQLALILSQHSLEG